jgi:hypothetical protein
MAMILGKIAWISRIINQIMTVIGAASIIESSKLLRVSRSMMAVIILLRNLKPPL